ERIDAGEYDGEVVDARIRALSYISTGARRRALDEFRQFAALAEQVERMVATATTTVSKMDEDVLHRVVQAISSVPPRSMEQVDFFLSNALGGALGGRSSGYLVLQARWDQKRGDIVFEARHTYQLPV